MTQQIGKLIERHTLEARVRQLASQIEADYHNADLTVVLVLTGALIFGSDLIRQIELPMLLETVKAVSYSGTQSGALRLSLDLVDSATITDRDVLIVDDNIDTGKTLTRLKTEFLSLRPRTLRTAVLLDKSSRRLPEFQLEPDYFGFPISDKFVVGYGLDLNGKYRNLPYIGVLNKQSSDL